MKKKIILISAAVVLATMLIAGGTLAWFTAADTATNTLTTGKIDIDIIETMNSVDAGGNATEVPYADPTNKLMPGDVVSKIVRIKNLGTGDAWIRAKATAQWTGDFAQGFTPDASLIVLDYNTADWTPGADGWYYYTGKVAADGSTNPLINGYTVNNATDNNYQDNAASIVIDAQGVQAANNGASAAAAEGWPANP